MNYDYHFTPDNNGNNQSGSGMPPVDMTPPANKGHGLAVASLILGIVSIVFLLLLILPGTVGMCCCCIGPITSIVGIILAIVSKVKAGRMEGMARAGLILSIVALVIFVVFIAVCIYIGVQFVTNPDSELSQWLDKKYYDATGESLREIIEEARRQAGAGNAN